MERIMKSNIYIIFFFVFIAYKSQSQDTIFRNDGTIQIGKVIDIDSNSVFYNSSSNGDATHNQMSRLDIRTIHFSKDEISIDSSKQNYILDTKSIGFGIGQDYGGFGVNILLYPMREIGVFGGLGYTFAGIGYNVGLKIRFNKVPMHSPTSFYILGMYGYNTLIKTDSKQKEFTLKNHANAYKQFYGPTLGIGCDIRFSETYKSFLSVSLLIPIRSSEIDTYIKDNNITLNREVLPISVSLGYHFMIP